jgi:hypothetical protein
VRWGQMISGRRKNGKIRVFGCFDAMKCLKSMVSVEESQ